ncbi:hypothetical protein NSTCB13_02642 [Nostoc sp. DSM 114160]|jgi:hypothetical protein
MEVNLPALIKYFEMLCSLEDGQQITVGEVLIKREGNRIWESVFIIEEEEYIDEETIEDEEET